MKYYGEITFVLMIKGVNAMNYRIVKKEEMHIIGSKLAESELAYL